MAAITWDRNHDRVGRTAPRPPVQLVTSPPSRRRPDAAVYRRRRLVALVLAAVLVLLVAQAAVRAVGASASAGSAPAVATVLVAETGDSYWSLAGDLHRGGDLRSTVDELVRANGGAELQAGDRIVLAP